MKIVSEGSQPRGGRCPLMGSRLFSLLTARPSAVIPRFAMVASVDLPLLAQLRAGDTVTFAEIPVAEAQELWLANERLLATVKQGMRCTPRERGMKTSHRPPNLWATGLAIESSRICLTQAVGRDRWARRAQRTARRPSLPSG